MHRYPYYFEQYSKYELDAVKYKTVAAYMRNLLEKTLPTIKTRTSAKENIQSLKCIDQAVEELFESARVNQYSYVCLCAMRRGSLDYK